MFLENNIYILLSILLSVALFSPLFSVSYVFLNVYYLLQGELTITWDMEELETALFLDQVPSVWASRAYPSLLGLTAWFADLVLRLRELDIWATDFVVRIIFNKHKHYLSPWLGRS